MAGGSGTRLWPLSRKGTPNQLLPLVDGKSLLRLAFERSLASVPADRVLVVTDEGDVCRRQDDRLAQPQGQLRGRGDEHAAVGGVAGLEEGVRLCGGASRGQHRQCHREDATGSGQPSAHAPGSHRTGM